MSLGDIEPVIAVAIAGLRLDAHVLKTELRERRVLAFRGVDASRAGHRNDQDRAGPAVWGYQRVELRACEGDDRAVRCGGAVIAIRLEEAPRGATVERDIHVFGDAIEVADEVDGDGDRRLRERQRGEGVLARCESARSAEIVGGGIHRHRALARVGDAVRVVVRGAAGGDLPRVRQVVQVAVGLAGIRDAVGVGVGAGAGGDVATVWEGVGVAVN